MLESIFFSVQGSNHQIMITKTTAMDSDFSEEMLLIFCGKCDPTQLGIVLNLC